jgi:hypothetical protein
VVFLLAQAAPIPPSKILINRIFAQIVLLGLCEQNLCLLRQARHVRNAQFRRRNAVAISTRASPHEAFSCALVHSLEANVAFLPYRVGRAFLDRDRDGLLIFLVGVILFCVAAAVYFLADLLVPAAPVVVLACGIAVPCFAPHTSRRVVGQWRGASGAVCEEHVCVERRLWRNCCGVFSGNDL